MWCCRDVQLKTDKVTCWVFWLSPNCCLTLIWQNNLYKLYKPWKNDPVLERHQAGITLYCSGSLVSAGCAPWGPLDPVHHGALDPLIVDQTVSESDPVFSLSNIWIFCMLVFSSCMTRWWSEMHPDVQNFANNMKEVFKFLISVRKVASFPELSTVRT